MSYDQKMYFDKKICKWNNLSKKITQRLVSKCTSGLTTDCACAYVRKQVRIQTAARGEEPGAFARGTRSTRSICRALRHLVVATWPSF